MSADLRLVGIYPPLLDAVQAILTAMAAGGTPMLVTNGVRTVAEQQALYAQGRTVPGPIVTHCDGVVKRSNHQPHADGWGHAVDCAFLLNGHPSWAEALPWEAYGSLAKAHGCVWGGEWVGFVDRPHIEMV